MTELETELIKLEIKDHIGLITLNRPDQLNTYTAEMGQGWNAAYQACESNDDVRVIVVTGAGKVFCAGADMSGGGETFDTKEDMSFSSCPVTPAWQLKKPVIGALNGHAVGIGFGLALQFDFRFVAEQAKYGLLQVRRGVLADCCSHWVLPRLIGVEKAMRVLVMAEKMTGKQVFDLGLATECVSSEQVLSAAMAFAHQLATHSAPMVAAATKQLIWRSFDHDLASFEKLETEVLHQTMGQPDAVEGGTAFFEKRDPKWTGSVTKDWPVSLSHNDKLKDK